MRHATTQQHKQTRETDLLVTRTHQHCTCKLMKPAVPRSAYRDLCLDAARLGNYFGHTARERELVRLSGSGRSARLLRSCKHKELIGCSTLLPMKYLGVALRAWGGQAWPDQAAPFSKECDAGTATKGRGYKSAKVPADISCTPTSAATRPGVEFAETPPRHPYKTAFTF